MDLIGTIFGEIVGFKVGIMDSKYKHRLRDKML
jgi:hypothetical protein